ncbi:MAG: hypothetical protein N3H30_02935 [Candidatus Micrarchaeota archaeon]|nr:hypothetical protein [Candidatus Micrarchaeota archaeon]
MLNSSTLSAIIGEYAAQYGGEIDVHLEHFDKDRFTVRFSGRICRSCGLETYFDGLQYMLRLGGIHVRVGPYREEKGEFIVTYYL